MPHFPGAALPSTVSRYLRNLRFPTHKQTLIQHARTTDAREDVFEALEELPEREYGDLTDVIEELAVRRDVRGRGDRDEHLSHEGPAAHRSGGQVTAPADEQAKGGAWPQLVKALEDVRFPASKRVLTQHAQVHGAGDTLLAALARLDDRSFDNIDEVMAALAGVHVARKRAGQDGPPEPRPAPAIAADALRGTIFPAWKANLLRRAEENGAAEDFRAAIAALPERQYGDISEVLKALSGGEDNTRQSRGTPEAGRPLGP